MLTQQLNSLVIGRAAGSSFGVPESDLGRLGLIAYTVGNPVLAIFAARSMAESDYSSSGKDPDEAQWIADESEAAEDAADKAQQAAETAQQQAVQAVAAALDAKDAADAAEKAKVMAQQAASDAQKAVVAAQEAVKSGVIALPAKK